MLENFFLPYQREWIDSTDRYRIYVKSRQIGLTFAEAFWSFRRRISTKIDHIFCSSNFKTSKEFIGYVKQFAEATNIIVGSEIMEKDAFQSEAVVFPNGSRIIIVSSAPTALRGFKADLTLDEFGFHENQEALFTAGGPVTTWNLAHFHIISTHNGEGTVFYQVLKDAEEKKNAFKVFRTTLKDAVDQGLCEKIPGDHQKIKDKEERRKTYINNVRMSCLNDKMFEQEYECKVLSASTLISSEQYDKCIYPVTKYIVPIENWNINLDTCGPVYVGIDPAGFNGGDGCVIYAIEQGIDSTATNPKLKTIYRTVLDRTLKGIPYESQYNIITGLISHSKIKRVLIEANGVGAALANQLSSAFPGKCIPWHSTSDRKSIAVETLAGYIAQGRITLPHYADIKADFLAMQRLASGKYDGRTKDSHCDNYMACSLSLQVATQDPSFFGFFKV